MKLNENGEKILRQIEMEKAIDLYLSIVRLVLLEGIESERSLNEINENLVESLSKVNSIYKLYK